MRLLFVRDAQIRRPALVLRGAAGSFGVEMVLARFPRKNLAVLRDFQPFCV